MTIDKIHVELLGREVVVSGSGTNRTTHRHEVHKEKIVLLWKSRRLRAGDTEEKEAEIHIPENAPFTFAAPDNALEWTVTLTVSIPKWPDWKQVYPIVVSPTGK